MNELRKRFGRPLHLAVVGGGPDSWIGGMHRGGAELDGMWKVVAGVVSSDPARARARGADIGLDPERSYATVAQMLGRERDRSDGIEGVAVMAPNDQHYGASAAALDAGLDVVCDKPVTHDLAQALDLVARTRNRDRIFAVSHGYSCYPMTRYARKLVREGGLGEVRMVQVEYIQNGLATRLEDLPQTNRLRWLLDPQRSGLSLVMSAIGCHAQHLACSVTGQRVSAVCAEAVAVMPERRVIDYTSALLRFERGARGTLTVTQAAAGGENDIRLRVYGERGYIEWSHREASYLRIGMQGEPLRIVGRGDPFLPPDPLATRSPRGHPEGLREAFANIYSEVAMERMARSMGADIPPLAYPTIEDGAHSMAFIEACTASAAAQGWTRVAATP